MLITTYTLHILIRKMDQQGTQKAMTHVGQNASIKIAECNPVLIRKGG